MSNELKDTFKEAKEIDPQVQQDGDDFHFRWINDGIEITLTEIRQGSDGIHAEIDIRSPALGPLHWGRINLASGSARETVYRKLRSSYPIQTEWHYILDETCRIATERIRAGSPITALTGAAPKNHNRYLIERFIPIGETSVLFGPRGDGKSLFALGLAVSVSAQINLPCGLHPTQKAAVLYLDYETTQDEQNERLSGLCAGLGVNSPAPIYYRQMTRLIADDAARLRAEISRRKIGLVIVDSLAPAFGNPNDPELVICAMNALRSFTPATRLVTSHISKAEAEQKTGATTPYGSVFVKNLARSVWEIRKAVDDEEDLVVGLYHRKVNSGRLHHPIGLRFEFGDSAIRIHSQDITEHHELVARGNLTYRMLKTMTSGNKTAKELAEELQTTENAVRGMLSRQKEKGKVIHLDDHRGSKWGLTATNAADASQHM